MPEPTLNERIALALGYQRLPLIFHGGEHVWKSPDGREDRCPDFAHDPAASAELKEAMYRRRWTLTLTASTAGVEASFYRSDAGEELIYHAPTEPGAVAEAAVAALESERKSNA